MDYVSVSVSAQFSACSPRQCFDVSIVDDSIPEYIEFFLLRLERSPGLDSRIILIPITATVEIIDDDCMFIMNITVEVSLHDNHVICSFILQC